MEIAGEDDKVSLLGFSVEKGETNWTERTV